MSTAYQITVTTNPDRVATLFMENGYKYLWYARRTHNGYLCAEGQADTVWGATRAAKRCIKAIEHEQVPSQPEVVYDKVWQP